MSQPPERGPHEYRCPGEATPISRAVHLGRLARFYSGCRDCPHREETASLPARHVKRLAETWQRGAAVQLFHEEGAGSDSANDLTPATVRRVAAAFGNWLRGRRAGSKEASEHPAVVLGADGSPQSPELVAAVADGLRWSGCGVVDVGPVTSACLTLALHSLGADGGICVGSGHGVRDVAMRFWQGASPLSAGNAMDEIRRLSETGVNRPTRRYGSIRRFPADAEYLAGLSGHYHALRPLRVVVDTASRPLLAYLGMLTARLGCRILACQATPQRLAELVRQEKAHFGVGVDSDAECCVAVDESACAVGADRLFLLVARHLLAGQSGAAIVVEGGWSELLADAIAGLGGLAVPSGAARAEMARQVCGHGAPLGADRSGRIWYYHSAGIRQGYCAADALRTLTLLLEILSQSDRPLSGVLDAAWPAR